MESSKKAKIQLVISLIFSVWFLLTSWMWVYWFNVVFSYPIGILALIFLLKGKKAEPKNILWKLSASLLVIGLVTSITFLFMVK